ncbi:MAG TPA: dienelactone hydrolase family protein [bacterium]|nr:dienelactone hydrolase family protein [bacterium]
MFRRTLALGLVLVGLLAMSACSHSTFDGTLDIAKAPPASEQSEIEIFEYDRQPIPIRMIFQEETDQYSVYLVKFDVKDFPQLKNRYARAFYFVQKQRNVKTPCMICLPPTGGGMDLTKNFAASYAEAGYTTLGFYRREMFFNPDKSMEYNVELFRQSVIDVRRGIDFLQGQPEVDLEKLGIMGASLGGIIGALSTVADGRIKATASLVSAGNLPKILDTSGYSRVRKFRNGLMKRYDVKRDKLKDWATPYLKPIDPLTYADRIDPARYLMINGSMDNIIKLSAAEDTWLAFGKPEWRIYPVGHYTSMLMINKAKKLTIEHFNRVLDFSAPAQ